MSKQYAWQGNMIGMGKRGGVLAHGKKSYGVGDVVPDGVLSSEAHKKFVDSGALKEVVEETAVETKSDGELAAYQKHVETTAAAEDEALRVAADHKAKLKAARTAKTKAEKAFESADDDKKAEAEAELIASRESLEQLESLSESIDNDVETAGAAHDAAAEALREAQG
jgi:phage-related minor tail protein